MFQKNVGVKKVFKLFIHFTRLGLPWGQLEQWENLIKSNLCTGAPLGSGATGKECSEKILVL